MNTTDTPAPVSTRIHRPGLRSLAILVLCETKMVIRDSAGLIVPLGLPLLILLTSAGSTADQMITADRTALDLFVLPLVITMVLTMVGVLNMPSFLAYYRRTGILRRLAVTPASPVMVLSAQVIVSILQSALGIILALVVAMTAFGAKPPVDLIPAFGVLALTATAMCAMGMIVAASAPTPNSAVAFGLVAFLLLGATGGMFGGTQSLPEPIAEIGAHLPFGASVEALGAAWAGQPIGAAPLLSLAAAIVVGVAVAAWLFRWE
ncbi:ABC transporter permease [Brachybacterium sp. FME24]|uniref:ABC transporter permease n=1 Tax=Brachybacterium sp. FME24 TaxID=2742605 RepID=UPI001868AE3D|nr:ABC transporter permease [Brachybacterium sp. FME24]